MLVHYQQTKEGFIVANDGEAKINELCRDKKEALHLTYQQIADGSGLPVDTVKKYLNRLFSKAPSVYVVGRICAFLGVSLDEYFDVPVEKDPRADDLIQQLHIELDKRAAYIKRLQDTVTEKNNLINDQAQIIEKQTKLLADAHTASRRLTNIIIALIILCIIIGIYAIVMDYLAPAFGWLRG